MEPDDLANFIFDNEEEEENVQLSSEELIELMEEIWVNEKFSPEILPHKIEVVDCVLGQLAFMEKNVSTLSSSDFKKGLHQLEIDRIRYLVTSYLRHRLEKIEMYVFHTLKREAERTEQGEDTYLSEAEQQFAAAFKNAFEQHVEDVTDFHPGLPLEEWRTQVTAPNMNSFVFSKAKKNIEGVVIDASREDDSDVVDLTAGSQIIISYNSIADLVKRSEVKLI